MNINNLFCTPEQGRRLKELVPELTSVFVWHEHPYIVTRLMETRVIPEDYSGQHTYTPALTLQELRDVAKSIRIRTTNDYWVYMQKIFNGNAPELAVWVIQRMEADRAT